MQVCVYIYSVDKHYFSQKLHYYAGHREVIYRLLPVEDVLGGHFEEGDEGVDYPVGQPLLVVHLGRALHRADRRVPDTHVTILHACISYAIDW